MTNKTPTLDAETIERARAERLLLRLFHYRHRPGISEPSEWYEGDIRMLLAYSAAEAAAALERAAQIADGWLAAFGQTEIKYVPATAYAKDAVSDIADGIRALKAPKETTPAETNNG